MSCYNCLHSYQGKTNHMGYCTFCTLNGCDKYVEDSDICISYIDFDHIDDLKVENDQLRKEIEELQSENERLKKVVEFLK